MNKKLRHLNPQCLKFLTIFILVTSIFITSSTFIKAIQPTQQYNKIYLNPFYRVSLSSNTNYNYNLTINPPDGISKVNSAIISFNVQINGQTQNFTLLVNNQSCNNIDYSIATAFSTTGTSQIYFDCSNRITQSGTYNIVLRSSVNTGTIQGWIDLTYMNNPKGDLSLSGTEYSPNDTATMFVQLKDNTGNAVKNGACYLDVWYPANGSNVHPYTIRDAPMLEALGDDGIYYYDMTSPSQLGVYMLSAKCSYAYNWVWIYPSSELVYGPNRTAITGTWSGATQNLNNPEDGVYDSCSTSGSGTCLANYTFNVTQYGNITNISSINIYYMGESTASKILTINYWNGTSMVSLPNTLTFVATGSSTAPSGLDSLVSNTFTSSAIIDGIVKIQLSVVFTGSSTLWNNWLSIALLSSTGTIQDVKGSSEMHVTNIANTSFSLINSQLPATVWNYTNRNLTYYNMTDTTNYTLIQNNQYNYTSRFNTIDNSLTQLNSTIYSQFSSLLINLTSQFNNVLTQITNIPQNVWNYVNRNLTYYANSTINITILTNTTIVNVQNVTINLTTQNVTVQNVSVQLTNYTINLTTNNVSVNNYTIALTNYTINLTTQNVTVQNVTVNVTTQIVNVTTQQVNVSTQVVNVNNYTINLTTNNVTVQNVSVQLTNYTINLTTNNVTVQNVSVIVDNYSISVNNYTIDVQNVTVNVTTQIINVTTQIINVTTQNITVQNISINSTDIASTVWNYSVRNLTYYENFTQSQQDLTNYSKIQDNQYNYTDRFNTIDNSLTQLNSTIYSQFSALLYNLTSQFNIILSQISNIPQNVWSYFNRNLTYYPDMNVTVLTNTSIVNVQNVTINLTTQNVSVNNVTVNVDNISVIVNNYSINVQNVTVNVTNDIINVNNYTIQVDNITVNVTTQTINVTTQIVNVDNVTVNITTQQINVTTQIISVNNVSLNISDITDSIWNYSNRSLTYYPVNIDLTNYSLISDSVWSYNNRSLTYYENFTQEQFDLTNYSKIVIDVWNYSNRSLTYYEFNNLSASDVWSYINRTLTYYALNNITANDIWLYNNRTLTYYPQSQDLTNYSFIADNVWNYSARYTHGVILN